MPSAASAFALGLLHGPAELLPISSSAHVGLAQAAALWPGVSRLGATLTAGRALGLDREEARHEALRSGIPVLAGATALKGARLAARGWSSCGAMSATSRPAPRELPAEPA